jgi:hypothetical protein
MREKKIIIEGKLDNNSIIFDKEVQLNSTISIDVNFIEDKFFYKMVVIRDIMFNKIEFFCDKKRLKIINQCMINNKYPIEMDYIDKNFIIKFKQDIISDQVKIRISVN